MSLITLNLPKATIDQLLSLLERLVTAVERIAGPRLDYDPRPITPKDYAMVTPEMAVSIQEAERDFAAQHQVLPGSPAYLAKIQEYEEAIRREYGEEGVEALPWRVKTGVQQTQDQEKGL